jgi:hypothetical protein
MDAEMHMDAAAEITKVINSSSMAGILNSMVSTGIKMSIHHLVFLSDSRLNPNDRTMVWMMMSSQENWTNYLPMMFHI